VRKIPLSKVLVGNVGFLPEHGKKGFVIITKSFVKIEITKTFRYNILLQQQNV